MYRVCVIALRTPLIVTALAAVYLAPAPSRAHFVLQSPPAVYEQSNYGDPQKAPPCGADGSEVGTGVVTAYMGGDKLMITIDETIYHPGHYRVALAINDPSELPPEPPVTPNNTDCGTAPIDAAPVFPVLADGLWVHDAPFGAPQSVEITLPTDVDCANCTLQVIQFMSNHGLNNPGGCYYHHCAAISIQSTQSGTTGGEETGGEGEATASPTTTMTTAATMTAPTSTTNPDETASSGGGTGSDGGDTITGGGVGTTDAGSASDGSAGDASSDGATDDGSGGCACDGAGEDRPAMLAALIGLLALRPRRRAARSR